MKKALLVVVGILFATSTASAMPFILDPDAVLTTKVGQTGLLDELEGLVDTTSTDLGAPGGAFSDDGDVLVKTFGYEGGFPTSTASYGSDWALAGTWRGLTGTSTDGKTGYVYDLGATLTLFATESSIGLGTDPGIPGDFGFTGVEVAELELVNVLSGGDAGVGVSLDFVFAFSKINENGDFWLDENGDPISLGDLGPGETLVLSVDANTQDFNPIVELGDGSFLTSEELALLTAKDIIAAGGIVETKIYARHHFTAGIDVVPEPATMALLGTGLFGLAGAGIRKKFAA